MNRSLLKETLLVYGFAMALAAGPALSILFSFDLSLHGDCNTYLRIAHLDFAESPVRRYRVVMPFIAGFIDHIGHGLFQKLTPHHFTGDFSLPFSFFLVNLALTGWLGVIVYRFCLSYGVSRAAALIGMTAVITSRWTGYFVGLPYVDALYSCLAALLLYSLKKQHVPGIIVACLLGPLSKESFVFLLPLVVFAPARVALRGILAGAIGIGITIAIHQAIDAVQPPWVGWMKADLLHFTRLDDHLNMLFSFYGIYKVLLNSGIWLLLPLMAYCYDRRFFRKRLRKADRFLIVFGISVILQMLLSGSMERIIYQAMPVFAVWIASAFDAVRPGIGWNSPLPIEKT
jgi:hypothetical protein